MTTKLDVVKALIHARGKYTSPHMATLIPQLRSEPPLPPSGPAPGGEGNDDDDERDRGSQPESLTSGKSTKATNQALSAGRYVIVWSYGVPLAETEAFHAFLTSNEGEITNACKQMKGVVYGGTYVNLNKGSPQYQTYWEYESPAGVDQWNSVLQGSNSRLNWAMERLSFYWGADPGRSVQRYRRAADGGKLETRAKATPGRARVKAKARPVVEQSQRSTIASRTRRKSRGSSR